MDVSSNQTFKEKNKYSVQRASLHSLKKKEEKSSARSPPVKGVITVICCLLINLTLGIYNSAGNILPYLTSYLRNATGEKSVNFSMAMWVDLTGFICGSLSMLVFGKVEQRLPKRLCLAIGWLLFTGAFVCNYWAVRLSFVATVCLYGAPQGIGQFIILTCTAKLAIQWFPKKTGLVNGIVMMGYGGGALFWNQMITAWINPHNLQPDQNIDESLYFTQPDVLNRVPSCYLLLGGVLGGIQLVCLFFISFPPSATPSAVVDTYVLSADEKDITSAMENDVTSVNEISVTSRDGRRINVTRTTVVETTDVKSTIAEANDVASTTVEKADVTSTFVEGRDITSSTVQATDVLSTTLEANGVTSTTAEETDVTSTFDEGRDITSSTVQATDVTHAGARGTKGTFAPTKNDITPARSELTDDTLASAEPSNLMPAFDQKTKVSSHTVLDTERTKQVETKETSKMTLGTKACSSTNSPSAETEGRTCMENTRTKMVGADIPNGSSARYKTGPSRAGSGEEMSSVASHKPVTMRKQEPASSGMEMTHVSVGMDNLAFVDHPEERMRFAFEVQEDPDDEELRNKMTFLEILMSRVMITLFFHSLFLDFGYWLINTFYKVYAQTYINNDHVLSLAASVAPVFNAMGRPLWGLLADRFGLVPSYLLALTSLSCMASTFLLCEWGGTSMFFTWLCTIYFSIGGPYSLMNPIIYDLFGSKNFISALGIIFSEGIILSPMLVYVSSALQHAFGWHGLFIFAATMVFLSFSILSSLMLDCGHPLSPRMQRALFSRRRSPQCPARAADNDTENNEKQ